MIDPATGKKMREYICNDPLTGGSQSIYYNEEGNFMMSIPHQAIQLSTEAAKAFRENLGTLTQTGPRTWTWETDKKDHKEDI